MISSKNLEAEMKWAGYSRNDIAVVLDLSYSTIHSRFKGNTQWIYEECVVIQKKLFPNLDLEYLFEVVDTNVCLVK